MNSIMSCDKVPCYKIFVIVFIAVFSVGVLWSDPTDAVTMEGGDLGPENLIRFHILANSDSAEDQETKYAVRDAVVDLMGKRLGSLANIDEARRVLRESEDVIVACAEDVIRQRGHSYPVNLVWEVREFPTRGYGNVTLPAGEYESVRILIGEAAGANWWCVLFPPLCFVQESVPSSDPGKTTKAGADPVDSTDPAGTSEDEAAPDCQESSVEKRFFFMDFVKELFGG